MSTRITEMLNLIQRGRIKTADAGSRQMGISKRTFTRAMAEARAHGARIQTNGHEHALKPKPWKVLKRGPY